MHPMLPSVTKEKTCTAQHKHAANQHNDVPTRRNRALEGEQRRRGGHDTAARMRTRRSRAQSAKLRGPTPRTPHAPTPYTASALPPACIMHARLVDGGAAPPPPGRRPSISAGRQRPASTRTRSRCPTAGGRPAAAPARRRPRRPHHPGAEATQHPPLPPPRWLLPPPRLLLLPMHPCRGRGGHAAAGGVARLSRHVPMSTSSRRVSRWAALAGLDPQAQPRCRWPHRPHRPQGEGPNLPPSGTVQGGAAAGRAPARTSLRGACSAADEGRDSLDLNRIGPRGDLLVYVGVAESWLSRPLPSEDMSRVVVFVSPLTTSAPLTPCLRTYLHRVGGSMLLPTGKVQER